MLTNDPALDLMLRRSMLEMLDRLGGQITILSKDLNERDQAITWAIHEGPDRVVLTLITKERALELTQQGVRSE